MCSAGLCIYNQLKLIHNLSSPPLHNTWKRNGKFGIKSETNGRRQA
ncbi:hypothetical protein HanXRQr2_Chr14g0653081 [Helianthus annuus]|uniref:Uncharacterized protein n=1 Tax=Helianthus annuus TaxID=4232 RepID=A0A9K3E9T7_HELAN|nr:hypothetical protein HanXRQr2_Chr14g0653081 [Helianthus annuus]